MTDIDNLVASATMEENQKLIDIHETFGLHFLIKAEDMKAYNKSKAAEYAMNAWAHMLIANNGHYLQLIKEDYIDNPIFNTDLPYNPLNIVAGFGDYVHALHKRGERLLLCSGILTQ